ncbi:phage integrase N-terminal domain-containing protein [Vibrio cholerae]|uniref:phage integrase N-terminal domain-containing protein n=1 Tax=Vibrio cholerae TaxID=666 RepID=UPI0011586209|nr:phage integrase N-terminal domain-containing protein [Vibrio cholerae]EMA7656777.1 integrase domain-containing protein [Vibrio cholerae]TQP75840.1 integrase [Vibrio cholerae]
MNKPNLRHGFALLLKRNPDGSYKTQGDRAAMLVLIEKQLREGGYRHLTPQTMKFKHVQYLTERWQKEGLSAGTIKNRMGAVRWVFEKMGREHLIPKSNSDLGIPNRDNGGNENNKAKTLDAVKLASISSPYVQASLQLQAAFGLRREEAIKFSPSYAIQDGKLVLKGSWTKGGKAREIPIRTEQQKAVLAMVRNVAGQGSLIPRNRNFIQQLNVYKNACAKAGLCQNHGLRHEYAQARYLELTGWPSPKAGGLSSRELTPEQKAVDREARLTISKELGHEREAITVAYLGR